MTNTNKKSKNTRKLLGAVGMLSVSAAMLVSSTFAWFSLNRTVTASSMTVTAKSADPFLKISAKGGADTNFYKGLAPTADSGNDIGEWVIQTQATINSQPTADAKMKLIAPSAIGSTMQWVWSSSSVSSNAQGTAIVTGDGGNIGANKKFQTVTLTEAAANKNTTYRSSILTGQVGSTGLEDAFVLKQTLSLKNISKSAAGTNLKIDSVTFTRVDASGSSTSTFDQAARILIVNEDGAFALYKGDGTLVKNSTTFALESENGASGTPMSATSADAAGKAIIKSSLAANTSTDITIYMYYDGNADEAYTDNAYDLNGVKADFSFSFDDASAANNV